MLLNHHRKPVVLRTRRLAILASTAAGLAIGGLFAVPTLSPTPPRALAQNLSQEAQHLAQPTGFADVVAKVKPAVISVRVKVAAAPQASGDDEPPFPNGSPMERFFRRF